MKLFTNRKAQSSDVHVTTSEVLFVIFTILGIALMFFVLLGKGAQLLDAKAAIGKNLEEDIRIARFTNVCAAYQQDGRVYQNVIDLSKVTQKNLENCFKGTMYVTILSPDGAFDTISLRHGSSTPENEYNRFVIVALEDEFYPARMKVRI